MGFHISAGSASVCGPEQQLGTIAGRGAAGLGFSVFHQGCSLVTQCYRPAQEDLADGHVELLQWRGIKVAGSAESAETITKPEANSRADVEVFGVTEMESTASAAEIAKEVDVTA